MHAEAMAWVAQWKSDEPLEILDLGGRNVNGSPRDLFPNAKVYRTLDIVPGDGVDIVADAGTWTPDQAYDVVVSTECFEHTANWRDIVRTAYEALRPGGMFIATMAGPGRPVHSGITGQMNVQLEGEFYGNVNRDDLEAALAATGFESITVDSVVYGGPCDTRCMALRP